MTEPGPANKFIRVAVLALGAICLTAPARAATAPGAFVQLYIRQLAQMDSFGGLAAACTAPNGKIAATIARQIDALKGKSFAPPFETLVPNLVQSYQRKLTLYQQLQTACAAPPADQRREILSNIDYVNRTIVNATPVVFGTLMDPKGAPSRRLVIGRGERARLLRLVTASFGKKINARDQSWMVIAATILRDGLANKAFKADDEP